MPLPTSFDTYDECTPIGQAISKIVEKAEDRRAKRELKAAAACGVHPDDVDIEAAYEAARNELDFDTVVKQAYKSLTADEKIALATGEDYKPVRDDSGYIVYAVGDNDVRRFNDVMDGQALFEVDDDGSSLIVRVKAYETVLISKIEKAGFQRKTTI
jgi:hypothetical protein